MSSGRARVVVALIVALLAALVVPVGTAGTAAAVTGTGTIQGTITSDGYAVPDAPCVYAWSGSSVVAYDCVTDGSGFYSLAVPSDTPVLLQVAGTTMAPDQFYGPSFDAAGATPVQVANGAVNTVDIAMATGGSIQGAVDVVSGADAVGGCVYAYRADTAVDGMDLNYSDGVGCVDGTGYFLITDLAPGDYYLVARDFTNGADQYHSGAGSFAGATPVTVIDGDSTFVPMLLEDLSTTGDLNGTVVADGAELDLGYVELYDAEGFLVAQVQPDAAGSFTFDQIAVGSYVLYGYGFGDFAPGYYQGAEAFEDATLVSVLPDQVTDVTFTFAPPAGLSGTVSFPDGTPAIGGCVDAYSVAGAWLGRDCGGENGAYQIPGIDGAEVIVQYSGFEGGVSGYFDGADNFDDATPVMIESGTTVVLDIEIDPAATISGYVTIEGGGITANGCVQAIGSDGSWAGNDCVDADGLYSLTGLKAGSYSLSFTNFDDAVDEWYDGGVVVGDATPVTVATGEELDLNVALAPAGTIAGSVTLPDGTPATGGSIYARDDYGRHRGHVSMPGDGTFVITGLPAGNIYLELKYFDNGVDSWFQGAADYEHATPVVVVAGETTTVAPVLEPAGSISGEITINGVPLADALDEGSSVCVRAYDSSERHLTTRCMYSGGPTMQIDGLPVGDVYLEFYAYDGSIQREWYLDATSFATATPISVVAGETAVADVDLTAGTNTIRGYVTLDSGEPAVNGYVYISGGSTANAWAGDDGYFEFTKLPDGDYTLYFNDFDNGADEYYEDASASWAATQITVAGGQVVDLEAHLTPVAIGAVAGIVTLPDGSPARGGVIYAYGSNHEFFDTAWVSDDGEYQFDVLPEGDVYLWLSDFDNAVSAWFDGAQSLADATPVAVVAGETTSVDPVLDAGGTIEGVVSLDSGAFAQGGCVQAYDGAGGQIGSDCVSAAGVYRINGLVAGDVYLEFSGFDYGLSQWAGGGADRESSTPVALAYGGTETFDQILVAGGRLEVTVGVAGRGPATGGQVVMVDAFGTDLATAGISEGVAVLPAAPAGDVYLRSEYVPGAANGWYGGATVFEDATPVTLTAGITSAIDFVLDSVPVGTVSGTVTVAGGAAALDGCVVAYDADHSYVGESCVDGSGYFELSAIEAETVFLRTTGFSNGASGWFDGATTFYGATPVAVTMGATTTVDMVLAEAATIGGTLSYPDGSPANDGCVYGYDANGNYLGVAWPDEMGHYAMTGLPAGDVYLEFTCSNVAVPQWNGGARERVDSIPVTVASGESVTVNQELQVGGWLDVTVAVDGLGEAADGYLYVYDEMGDQLAQTSLYGEAVYLGPLPAGQVFLRASSVPGAVPAWFDGATSLEDATPVDVVAGEHTAMTWTLAPVPVGAIEGDVTVVGGAPALDGCVTAYDADWSWLGDTCVDEAGHYVLEGLEGASVRLRLAGFSNAAGEWYDGASSFDGATSLALVDGGTVTVDIELDLGATVAGHVTLEDGTVATGGCVAAYDAVTFEYLGDTCVDELGAYSIGGLPAGDVKLEFSGFDGGVDEWFDDARYFDTATPIAVSAGNVTTVDGELALAGSVAGTVTLFDGSPGMWGCVYAYKANGDYLRGTCADDTGYYELSGLPAGDVLLEFSWFDGAPRTWYDGVSSILDATPVGIVAGATTALDVQLPQAGGMAVTVNQAGANGVATNSPCVLAVDMSGDVARQYCTDQGSGPWTFDIDGLAPGSYYVGFEGSSSYPVWPAAQWLGGTSVMEDSTVVTVTAGASTGVTFDLAPVGEISGQVTRENDALAVSPDAPREVYVYGEAADGSWSDVKFGPFTTEWGSNDFVIPGLLPGDYKVGFRDHSSNTVFAPEDTEGPTTFYGGADLASASVVTVTAGGTVSGVDGVLPVLGVVTPTGWTLSGTLTTSSGAPWVGADVVVAYDGGGGDAVTDASGHFSFTVPVGVDAAVYLGTDIGSGTLVDLVGAPAGTATVTFAFQQGDATYELVGSDLSLTAAGAGESLWRRADPVGKDSWLWGAGIPSAGVLFGPAAVELVGVADMTGDGLDDIVVHRALAGDDAWRVYSVADDVELRKFFGPGEITGFYYADVTGGEGAELIAELHRGDGMSVKLWIWDVEADTPVEIRYTAWGNPDKVWTVDMDGNGKAEIVYSEVRPTQNDAFWIFDVDAANTRRVNVGPDVIDEVLFADTDGDDYKDIITFRLRPGNSAYWSVWESATDTKVTIRAGWGATTPAAFDVDGDGRAEVLAYRQTGANNVRWWYASTDDPETVTVVDLPVGILPAA